MLLQSNKIALSLLFDTFDRAIFILIIFNLFAGLVFFETASGVGMT